MQRSECRTPSWLGGYAERRSISMMEHQNAKFVEFWQKMTLLTAATSKNSLHPSRRMAWKILRHGVAGNFPSPRKKTRHSSPNPPVPIKFYKISENNSIFILFIQNKALSLQRNWRPLLPIRASSPLWEELAIGCCRERSLNPKRAIQERKKLMVKSRHHPSSSWTCFRICPRTRTRKARGEMLN